jgi:hypothetical protein
MPRYTTYFYELDKCYHVFDTQTNCIVADTDDTDLETVQGYAEEMNDKPQAPPHGSLYGEPCGDRK